MTTDTTVWDFDGIRAAMRPMFAHHPAAVVLRMGSEAMNCYGQGLEARYGVVSRVTVPQPTPDPTTRRAVYDPTLEPWEMSL